MNAKKTLNELNKAVKEFEEYCKSCGTINSRNFNKICQKFKNKEK